MAVKQTLIAKHLHKTVAKNSYPKTPVCETLTNGFFTVDNKWTVKYWNKAAEKILKVKATDIIGKTCGKNLKVLFLLNCIRSISVLF